MISLNLNGQGQRSSSLANVECVGMLPFALPVFAIVIHHVLFISPKLCSVNPEILRAI